MKYDDIPVCPNEASENEWLDVKFSQTKKLDQNTQNMLLSENETEEDLRKNKVLEKIKHLFYRKTKIVQQNIVSDVSEEAQMPELEENEVTELSDVPHIVRRIKHEKRHRIGSGKSIWQKCWKPVAACAIIAMVLAGMKFADVGFVGDVFEYAKMTFTSTMASSNDFPDTTSLTVPATANIAVKNGDITLSGGKLVLNLSQGKVINVTADSVSVNVGDKFDIIYTNLTEVLVKKDEKLSPYQVIGRYKGSAVVNLLIDGQKVANVSVDGYTLKWKV